MTLPRIAGTNSAQSLSWRAGCIGRTPSACSRCPQPFFRCRPFVSVTKTLVKPIVGVSLVRSQGEDEVGEDPAAASSPGRSSRAGRGSVPEEKPFLVVQVRGHLAFQPVEIVLGDEPEEVQDELVAVLAIGLLHAGRRRDLAGRPGETEFIRHHHEAHRPGFEQFAKDSLGQPVAFLLQPLADFLEHEDEVVGNPFAVLLLQEGIEDAAGELARRARGSG